MLDRLLHGSVVINPDGEPYRLREHQPETNNSVTPPQAIEHRYSDTHTRWGKSVSNPEDFQRAPSTSRVISSDDPGGNHLLLAPDSAAVQQVQPSADASLPDEESGVGAGLPVNPRANALINEYHLGRP